jgi:hypothetical protein
VLKEDHDDAAAGLSARRAQTALWIEVAVVLHREGLQDKPRHDAAQPAYQTLSSGGRPYR